MEKLIGNKNIAVFISGRGTNLKALINFSKKTKRFNITSVVSDNKDAKGLTFVKKNKIKYLLVNYKNKSCSEKKIYNFIKKEKVSLVALAGFMRILSKKLIKKIKIPIVNIHPSLLPKYKGLNTHARALEANDPIAGCTVHLVTPKLDAGPVLAYAEVAIQKSETIESLASKVLIEEHKLYPKVLLNFSNQIIKSMGAHNCT